MDKPSSSRPPQKSAAGRRVRLIPSTPRPGGAMPPPAQQGPPNMGIPQPPETFGGNLYANIIRETMGRWNRARLEVEREEENSEESQKSTSSSSSLRFSDGRTFDEIADEVIQRRREEEREGVSGETQEVRGTRVVLVEEENRVPLEDPVREVQNPTGARGEEVTAPGDWKAYMEGTVNQLLVENAEQNAKLKAQEEKLNRLFGIVERMVSGREEGTQESRRPLPARSIASQNKPSRHGTETNQAETSRKRKPTATTSQPTPASKRTRHPGSQWSQSED